MYKGEWWSVCILIVWILYYFHSKVKLKKTKSSALYALPLPRLLTRYLIRRGFKFDDREEVFVTIFMRLTIGRIFRIERVTAQNIADPIDKRELRKLLLHYHVRTTNNKKSN